MQYKTIVLELLEQQTELYDRLRSDRQLLTAVEQKSAFLRARHLHWKRALLPAPGASESGQVASRAMELAIRDLRAHLQHDSTGSAAEA